jgi:hypothetical protein
VHPHLRAVAAAAQPREDGRTARLDMALGAASYLLRDYAGAQPAFARALAIHERDLGPDHPDSATVRENYTILLRHRMREAAPLSSLGRRIRAWLSRIREPH